MSIDPLKQFARLREALLSEKARIEARLTAINAVLETPAAPVRSISRSLDKISAKYLDTQLSDYSPRKGTLPAKILKVLTKGGAMQVKDIASTVETKAVLVNQACAMLLKKGRLKREGRGLYSAA